MEGRGPQCVNRISLDRSQEAAVSQSSVSRAVLRDPVADNRIEALGEMNRVAPSA